MDFKLGIERNKVPVQVVYDSVGDVDPKVRTFTLEQLQDQRASLVAKIAQGDFSIFVQLTADLAELDSKITACSAIVAQFPETVDEDD